MWGVGINVMRGFMKLRPPSNGILVVDEYGTPVADVPYYQVDPACKNTIREHNNYRSKDPIKGQNVPELGQNVQNHTIDAIRYALVQLFHLGVNHHLSEVYDVPAPIPTLNSVKVAEDEFVFTPAHTAVGIFTKGKEF
jgi:hypothetical protein